MRRLGTVIAAGLSLSGLSLYAQFGRGGGDWTTTGNDAQRSSWVRSDPKISLASLEKPGFTMIWKVGLVKDRKAASPLSDAVLLDRYIGYRGFRTLGFTGGLSNTVYALDTDLSRVEWHKSLGGVGSSPCAASLVTQVARPTGLEIASATGGGRGFGRGGFARGGVGEPNEGAPILVEIANRNAQMAAAAGRAGGRNAGRNGGRNAGRGAIPNAFRRGPSYVYALTSDGLLHQMYVSNGDEPEPAFQFLPPNANASGLIVVGDMAYAVTTKGCGGVPEGVWAIDLKEKKVANWRGSIVGSAGIAFDPDGNLYVATGAGASAHANSVVALDAKTLEPKDWYTSGSEFSSTPVIFEHRDKLLVAAATRDGNLHLLNLESLGGADHKTPLSRATSPASGFAPGALASWEDSGHVRWILGPAGSAVVAWKLTDQNGAPALASGWQSREMASPFTPMIVHDVVFALAGGKASSPAVLYALNPATGKELWNSGKSIESFVPSGGLSAGGGQLYVGAADGTLYTFGFPMEH